MKILISQEQINSLLKIIEKLINKNDFVEVCKYVVGPPTPDMNAFKVRIYLNDLELSKLGTSRLIRDRIDKIVNDTWKIAYNFLDIPLNIYIWRVKSC